MKIGTTHDGRSTSPNLPTPSAPRGSWRRLALPASGAAAAVAFLLVAVPVVGAGSASLSWSAPYTSLAKIYNSNVNSWGCHAYANDPVTPAINTGTGVITSWQRSVAGNCNSGTVWASTSTDLGFLGPKWTAAATGSINVTVTWTIQWSARATADIQTTGSASTAWATASLWISAFVVDTTASSNLWGTGTNNWTLADLSTSNGTALAHVTSATSYTLSFTLNVVKGHWLELDSEVYGSTYDSSSMCDQTAWSQVDFGSSGDSATLASVTVS